MTNPDFGPNRRQDELVLRSWHREEKTEEALLTSLKDWAKLPPARPGRCRRRHFGPREEPGQQGLLTFILSMPRAPLPRRPGGDLAQP